MRTKRLVLPLLGLLLAGLVAPAISQAQPPHRRRTVIIRRYYVHPYWYSYRYDPFYDPWYRGYPASYYREETMGTVEVKVKPDDGPKARLYVNGALADEFKSKEKVKLRPGEYRIEVRKPGYESEARTVYVTAGKKIKLEFHLEQRG